MDETKKNDSTLARMLTAEIALRQDAEAALKQEREDAQRRFEHYKQANVELGALVSAQQTVIEHMAAELAKSRAEVR